MCCCETDEERRRSRPGRGKSISVRIRKDRVNRGMKGEYIEERKRVISIRIRGGELIDE